MHEYTQMQVRTTVAVDIEQYGKQMQDCAWWSGMKKRPNRKDEQETETAETTTEWPRMWPPLYTEMRQQWLSSMQPIRSLWRNNWTSVRDQRDQHLKTAHVEENGAVRRQENNQEVSLKLTHESLLDHNHQKRVWQKHELMNMHMRMSLWAHNCFLTIFYICLLDKYMCACNYKVQSTIKDKCFILLPGKFSWSTTYIINRERSHFSLKKRRKNSFWGQFSTHTEYKNVE